MFKYGTMMKNGTVFPLMLGQTRLMQLDLETQVIKV